jgi:hypothetical protein
MVPAAIPAPVHAPVPTPAAPSDAKPTATTEVVCIRSRADAFTLAECCRAVDAEGASYETRLYVVALCDDGVLTEIAALDEPDDPVGALVDLIEINQAHHDFPVWGYFVAYVGSKRPARLLTGLPHRHELDWIDRVADDHGVELVDWLIVGEGEGVSALAVYGLPDRWLDPECPVTPRPVPR